VTSGASNIDGGGQIDVCGVYLLFTQFSFCRIQCQSGELASLAATRTPLSVSEPPLNESHGLTHPCVGCYGLFCFPCQFGETSSVLGSASCFTACVAMSFCTPCVLCLAAPGRRGKLRSALGVNGVPLPVRKRAGCCRLSMTQSNDLLTVPAPGDALWGLLFVGGIPMLCPICQLPGSTRTQGESIHPKLFPALHRVACVTHRQSLVTEVVCCLFS